MRMRITASSMVFMATMVWNGCSFQAISEIPVNDMSVAAGTEVMWVGEPQNLIGDAISIGDTLSGITLTNPQMNPQPLEALAGKTVVLSIVPTLDTQVCERQTHILGEATEEELPFEITRVSISRDLPFAQNRFTAETGFYNVLFLSDYNKAEFGMRTGLLMEDLRLLARAVMVLDRDGVVRYIQIVPEVSHLPDMESVFSAARDIDSKI